MSEEVTVWRAQFVGLNETFRIRVDSFPATRTEKRVAVHGAGSFQSDEYWSPDSVHYTERDAVAKLAETAQREREQGEYLLARAARMEALLEAKLAELHDWQPIETRWGGAYRCTQCGSVLGDPEDGPCPS